jgi:hypothetical protein
MSRDSALIRFFSIVGFAGTAAVGLTLYGFPIGGAATDPELYDLIAQEPEDSQVPQSEVQAEVSALGIAPLPDTAQSAEPKDSSTIQDPVSAWRAVAVRKDSTAVRKWLGRGVLATGETRGDTVLLTLWRLTLRPGCPLLSKLVSTSTGAVSYDLHRVKVTSTCPVASSN